MYRFGGRSLAAQQGTLVMFSDYKHDGQMWTGSGERVVQREVRFAEPFSHPPLVQVSMSMWDIDQQTSPRADLSADRITETGFWMTFKTWGDTRIARIRADWTALGNLPDEDDWELY